MTIIGAFAAILALYTLFSRRIDGSIISAPMIFVTAGLLLAADPIDMLSIGIFNQNVLLAAEVALVLVLFGDATRVRVPELRTGAELPLRLLSIGLVLTVVAGTLGAMLVFRNVSFVEAAVLAAMLAPTDAGLGAVVVSDRRLPRRIRSTLNIESGLNDGFVTPIFLIILGILVAEEDGGSVWSWIETIVRELTVGVIAGVVIAVCGTWLVKQALSRDWMLSSSLRITFPALAISAWQFADRIEGNGFVAAFIAGIVTAWLLPTDDESQIGFIEANGEILVWVVFFIFSIAATEFLDTLTFEIWLYALLSLTVIRIVPVALALIGSQLRASTILFIGWFGPRGLASIVLLIIFVNEDPGIDSLSTIINIVALTVLISVYVHGISASPLVKIYSRALNKLPRTAAEFGESASIPVRGKVIQTTPELDAHDDTS